MREIKFRAWDKQRRCFFSQRAMSEVGGFYAKFGVTPDPGQFVLQQYTGLKDKNGREIYEGDILSYPGTYDSQERDERGERTMRTIYIPGQVKFTDGHFTVGGMHLWVRNNRSEIVGNIYEKSEEKL